MWPAHMPRATTRRRGGAVLTNTTEIGTAMLPLRSVTRPARADVSPSALAYVRACVRTAGDAGQVAWRIPAASAAGIVRSGPGAGRDVRECETEILCASEPDGLAAGAGALPRARRRCEAWKRTYGPGPRACLALLAATALLALAAPAQAQTEVWSATLTPGDLSSGILGCTNGVSTGRCSSTSLLSEDSFNYDSTDYNITVLLLRPDGRLQFQVDAAITTATAALTLVVGSTALVLADATTISSQTRTWNSSGVSLTIGTDITVKLTAPGTPNTAAMGAPTITGTAQVDQTLTAVTTGITDADGLTSPTYTYQWIRVDGTDEEDISGENSSTYTLVDADLGKTIKVKVSFDDDLSHTETLTSAATVTVTAATTTNTAPTADDKTVTTGEDRAYAFTADDFGFDDDDAGDTLASVTIVTVPAAGTLALDGTAVLAAAVVTKAQIDGDMLTFTPARDAHGDPYTTFTFTVNDGTDDSASAYTMTIDVTDAPVAVCGVPDIVGAGRRQIWTGTVTVGQFELFGVVTGYGFSTADTVGSLSPSLTFPIGSNNYTIASIAVRTSGLVAFAVDIFDGGLLTRAEEAALRLHVCDESFDFDTAQKTDASFEWNSSLDWSPPVTSRTVYLSLPANNPATGEPAITGTAQAGQELTADASLIMDTDGVPSSFTYQWVRVDADGTSNPVDITDATAATYTLTAADAGKKIKVQVSFTDELSGEEERTSAAYPSSGTVTTAANTTAPALTSVTVTSTPRKESDTYGAREHIEFSMTFDAPVTVTGDPTFAFDLGGASTATWYAGSGTTTLRFSHAVSGGSSGDRDTNGISWAENAIALNGGTIAGTDNAVAAVLTHVAQSNLAGHKVDGRTTAVTPATVTVAVTSTPTSLADTYGFGETIVITVTASEAVEVVGDPVFLFSLTVMGGAANDPPATYDRTRSTATTIVFTYTVQAGDRDNNGIWIGDHSRTFMLDVNDRIRTASQQIDIDRSHPEYGTYTAHKVDGSLGAPTVPPDPTAPTLVSATATTLTIEWTHPGDGGSPLTRNFIEYRVEGTTDWTNWYRGETPTAVTRTVITNLQAETAYDVRVHATNAIGNSSWTQSATAFSTLGSMSTNTAATGAPTITGTAAVGQPLAVDLTGIEDADGLTNVSYSYQWVRVDADGLSNPADIADETDATYTLVDADLGKTLKVRVTFDDDGGSTETLTSDATATVTPAAGAPDPPTDLSATVGVGQVVLVWQRPAGTRSVHTHYEHRSSPGEMIPPDAMWQQVQTGPGAANTAYYQVVKGLTSDTTHTLQVRAVNPQGGSAPATVTATPLSQPSCTIDELGDRRRLWQGQLTAGVIDISTDAYMRVGSGVGIETGTLTPDAVTFRSITYSVAAWTFSERLNVDLRDQDGAAWYPREEVVDALRMHVCNTPYDFSDATQRDLFSEFGDHSWNVGLSWRAGIERTLRLSLPPNHAATGDPVISGTVQVGEELTALTDGIMDDDELDDVFTYQWVRVDADGTSNEEDITDETDATYTLTDDERGKKVKVEVRFVDILGGEETRTSAPTETLPGVTVSPTALTVTEEDTTGAGYTVVLDSQPTATVTVTVAGHAGTDVTPSPTSLTFTTTTWGTAQTVTVTAGADADTANDAVTLTHSAASTDTGYEGISIDGVAVTVTDNDNDAAPGVTVSTTALTVTEEDTTGARYTVVLDSQPTATVTVTVAGHAGTDVTPSPTSLTFTPMTWGTTQTVTVTAGADADTANDAVTLTHSAASTDSDYGGISIDGVAVTVTDNDDTNTAATGKPTITGTAQVGETLTAVTTGIMDVDGLTNPEYKYQWIRVNGPEADIADANSSTYTLGAADLGTTLKVRVTFRDDDKSNTETRTSAATETVVAVAMTTPGVTVSKTALTVTEEDTTGATYTVVLDSQPTATVTVTVAGHAGTDVTPSPTSLTFTTTTWGTAQTVTVTAGADADTANDAVTLTHSAASTDTGYEGITIAGVAVTVTDNDNDAPPGVTVSTSALTVTEEDPTGARYTVVLNSEPTATVTVTVAGHAGTDVSLTPSSATLTFTPMNWGTAQTVTVTAGPDADAANESVSLTHSAASPDSNYQGITIGGVAVTVRDNDTPPPSNNAPTVSSVSCDPCAVAPGGEVRLSAEASDPDGDRLTYAWSAPTGSFTGATDGAAARWRAPAETARVTVRVQVSDGRGGTASATVTVEVGANAPPAFEQSSYGFELPEHEDGRRRPVALGAVKAEDPDDDAVTYVLASGDGERFAVGAHDGAVTYVGAGEDFEAEPNRYELSVRARDQHGAAARVRVTVAVTNANEPPSAEDDEAGTAEDQRVVIDVLANDTDPDGDRLRVESVSAPAHGMARVASRGGVAYTPDADYHGLDRFTYVVADGHGETAAAAVEVTVAPVNDAPMAAGIIPDQRLSVGDEPGSLDLRPFFDDRDGDPLSYTAVASDTAVAVGLTDATLTLTVARPGAAMVTVTAQDPGGLTATQAFMVTMTDRQARGVIEDTLAADGLGRGHLASARATLGRRVETTGQEPSHVTVAGLHVPLGAGARGVAAAGQAVAERWITGLAGGRPLQTRLDRDGPGRMRVVRRARPLPRAAWPAARQSAAAAPAQPALSGVSPFGGGGQTDFLLTLGTGQAGRDAAQGPRWTVWGQSDLQSFAGERSPTARYDGELWTTYVGVDARLSERWLAGVAVSRSRGNGDWTVGASTGRLTTTLTSVQPYLRWSDGGTTIWATGGGGPGTARNALYGLQAESDLELRLGLVEVRRRLATVGGGVELQLRGDASWARLTTAEGNGLIDALAVEVRQLRVGIDVSRPVRTAGGTLVEPFGEVHARRDGGAGQTGVGLEVAGGLRVARGVFRVEGMGRLLALHAADGYRERGGAVTLSVGDGARQPGLTLSLSPRWGAQATASDALWQDQLFQQGTAGDPGGRRDDRALDARVDYGLPLPAGGLLTPFGIYGQTPYGRRLQVGLRLSRLGPVGLEVSGERAALRQPGRDDYRISALGSITFGGADHASASLSAGQEAHRPRARDHTPRHR